MSTWRQGRTALLRKLERDTMPLRDFIAQVHGKARAPGTAVYLTSRLDVVPVPLLHNLKHNKVLHERIVLLHVVTRHIPRVPPDQRLGVVHLSDNFHSVVAYYGFMQNPNVPRVLERCSSQDPIQHDGHLVLRGQSDHCARGKVAPQRHPLQTVRGFDMLALTEDTWYRSGARCQGDCAADL